MSILCFVVDAQESAKGTFPIENHIDSLIAKDEGVVSDDPEDLHEIEPPDEDRMEEYPPELVETESADDEQDGNMEGEDETETLVKENMTAESVALSEAGIHQVAEVKTEELDAEQVTDMNCLEIMQNSENISTEYQPTESDELFEDATDKLDSCSTQEPHLTSIGGEMDNTSSPVSETVPDQQEAGDGDNFGSLENVSNQKDHEIIECDNKMAHDLREDDKSTDLDAVILENLKESAIDSETEEVDNEKESISNLVDDAPPSVEI